MKYYGFVRPQCVLCFKVLFIEVFFSMVLVRYNGETDLNEEFMFCTQMETMTTGADIFSIVDNFQEKESIIWENCVNLCADSYQGGVHQGFTVRVNKSIRTLGAYTAVCIVRILLGKVLHRVVDLQRELENFLNRTTTVPS